MKTRLSLFCNVFILFGITFSVSTYVVFAQENNDSENGCISYTIDSDRNTISISCIQSTTLTDIYNAIQNPDSLKKRGAFCDGIIFEFTSEYYRYVLYKQMTPPYSFNHI